MVSLAATVSGGLAAGCLLVSFFALVPIPLLGVPMSPENRTWVAKNVTQCSEPWDLSEPKEEQTKYDLYFNARGIRIYDVQYIRYAPDDAFFCAACSCSSGSTLYLEVANFDVAKMKLHGFVEKEPQLS